MRKQNPESPLGMDVEARAYRQLANVERQIRNEHDFISSRTGWLLTSHAFLFSALAVLLSQQPTSLTRLRVIRTVMLMALPFIGVASSYLIWQAVLSAHHVLRIHRGRRRRIESLLVRQFQYSVATPNKEDLRTGDRPPMWLPLILGAVWLLLLSLVVSDVVESLLQYGVFSIATGA